MRLDLEQLDAALKEPDAASALDAAYAGLEACAAPDLAARIACTPARALMLAPDDADLLHPETWARLDGPPEVYDHPDADPAFKAAARAEPDLTLILRRLRRAVTGLKDGLRRTGVRAGGGFTMQDSVFPPPEAIAPALKTFAALRAAAPLHDPVWNALLLRLMLQRLHPFAKGNGRTFRALLSYELHRAGLIGPAYIPVARILDANRPALIRARNAITTADGSDEMMAATARALALDGRLIGRLAEQGKRLSKD
jgi:hypothetical protein